MSALEQDVVANGGVKVPPISSGFSEKASGVEVTALVRGMQPANVETQFTSFSPDSARAIYIRGYGVTSADDAKPVLGTSGAGPCVIVAVYNPATRSGSLAHFDTNTDVTSLDRLIEGVGGASSRGLQVTLTGGEFGSSHSHRLVGQIVDRLSQNQNITMRDAGLLNPSGALQALALDTRTGATYSRFFESDMDRGPRDALMIQHINEAFSVGPLRPEYVNGQVLPADILQKPQPNSETKLK